MYVIGSSRQPAFTLSPPANGTQGMNCEKNAVVCEGYNEKTLWKSGKERAADGTCSPPLVLHMVLTSYPRSANKSTHHHPAAHLPGRGAAGGHGLPQPLHQPP